MELGRILVLIYRLYNAILTIFLCVFVVVTNYISPLTALVIVHDQEINCETFILMPRFDGIFAQTYFKSNFMHVQKYKINCFQFKTLLLPFLYAGRIKTFFFWS
jgi:hypothetical protein